MKQVMVAVGRMTEVAESQSKIVERWINMFDQSAQQAPRRWTRDISQENREFLTKHGMPDGLTEAEQADWVKRDLGLL